MRERRVSAAAATRPLSLRAPLRIAVILTPEYANSAAQRFSNDSSNRGIPLKENVRVRLAVTHRQR